MKIKTWSILIIILIFSTILRFVAVDKVPPSLSNDEISIAYNAYAISQTLKDQYGHFLPISFQSYDTYKAPLAIYLAVPEIKIFGNTTWSVKSPSMILGVLTVLFLGLLVFELTGNETLTILSSLVLAITPLHIQTSRVILESNIGLFFLVFGLWGLFKGLNRQTYTFILVGFSSLALSLYGYHTEWGLTPLLITVFYLVYLKQFRNKKIPISGLILFGILLLPLVIDNFHDANKTTRANTERFYYDPGIYRSLQRADLNLFQKSGILIGGFLSNYSAYTNLSTLFFSGLNVPAVNAPIEMGYFLSILLPMFIIGLLNIKKYFKKHTVFIYSWIVLSPVVPALTKGGVNMVRDLPIVAPYGVTIAVGCMVFLNYVQNRAVRVISVLIVIFSFSLFALLYYRNFPDWSAENYQYGYEQAANYILNHKKNYQQIIVDPRYGKDMVYFGVPDMYILYYTKVNPQEYIRDQLTKPYRFFDIYQIRNVDWSHEKIKQNIKSLYVIPYRNAPPDSVASKLQLVKDIDLPNGDSELTLYATH